MRFSPAVFALEAGLVYIVATGLSKIVVQSSAFRLLFIAGKLKRSSLTQRRKGAKRCRVSKGFPLRLCVRNISFPKCDEDFRAKPLELLNCEPNHCRGSGGVRYIWTAAPFLNSSAYAKYSFRCSCSTRYCMI